MNLTLILNTFLLQLLHFVLLIGAVGYLISLLNRLFYRMVGDSQAVCYATGFLGTPIHELSHAVMCLLFFHRIEEMSLFRIGDDGVLGYVNHSYNPRNLYHKIGNYFIGIAPIVGGGLVLFFGMQYLAPSLFSTFREYIENLALVQAEGFGLMTFFAYAAVVVEGMLTALFSVSEGGVLLWVFYVLALCIALHMNLSGADIKGALPALPILIGALAVINLLLGVIAPGVYEVFSVLMNLAGGFLTGILLISLVFSAAAVVLAGMGRGVLRIFHR